MNFSNEFLVKLRSLLLTALSRVPSTASNSRPKRSSRRQRSTNSRNTARKAARFPLRKSAMVLKSGLRPQQPDHLDVAMAFGFQPPARTHPVQVAVDVELQKVARRVARATCLRRLDARETRRRQIKLLDESIDEADWVVGADVIVDRLRKQKGLRNGQFRICAP